MSKKLKKELQDQLENIEYKINAELDFVTNRQYIYEQNDNRSLIKVIQPEYINVFAEEFENLINASI